LLRQNFSKKSYVKGSVNISKCAKFKKKFTEGNARKLTVNFAFFWLMWRHKISGKPTILCECAQITRTRIISARRHKTIGSHLKVSFNWYCWYKNGNFQEEETLLEVRRMSCKQRQRTVLRSSIPHLSQTSTISNPLLPRTETFFLLVDVAYLFIIMAISSSRLLENVLVSLACSR